MRADLHTHSIFSDGELIPAELVRTAKTLGHRIIAITDHVDMTNVEHVVKNVVKAAELTDDDIKVIPGVEVTHVPPSKMDKVIADAKRFGAKWIVVHGETVVEPVEPGTNRQAVMNPDVDVLAHPGFITEEEMQAAIAKLPPLKPLPVPKIKKFAQRQPEKGNEHADDVFKRSHFSTR